jgi:hypothetical protein
MSFILDLPSALGSTAREYSCGLSSRTEILPNHAARFMHLHCDKFGSLGLAVIQVAMVVAANKR